MANKMRGEVQWSWDGEDYRLRLTNNDLLSLESALEGSAGEILNRISDQKFGVRDSMQILSRALITGARLTRKEAQALLDDVPLMEMMPVAMDCLLSGYGIRDQVDDEDPEEEPKAKKKSKTADPF